MYEPTHFIVNDRAALHKVIVDHPLGLLISVGGDRPVANAVPTSETPSGPGNISGNNVSTRARQG